jgi:hypothetical protein
MVYNLMFLHMYTLLNGYIKLSNIPIISQTYLFFVTRTRKIYSLTMSLVCNTLLVTIVSMLYNKSFEHLSFV